MCLHSTGILLVLAGQVAGAVQYVIEEKFLKTRNFHPLHVVGQEGVFGVVLMIIVVLPIVYVIPGSQPSAMSHGSYENRFVADTYILHSVLTAYAAQSRCGSDDGKQLHTDAALCWLHHLNCLL